MQEDRVEIRWNPVTQLIEMRDSANPDVVVISITANQYAAFVDKVRSGLPLSEVWR